MESLFSFLTFVTLLCGINSSAQTTFSLGDIAIIDYQSDNPDRFSFISFVEIEAGTSIVITDQGWNTTTGLEGISEGELTWTANDYIFPGTVITIIDNLNNTYFSNLGTVVESDLGFSLATEGDQLLIYQGNTPSIDNQSSFITAFHSGAGSTWDAEQTNTNSSAKPSVFIDGVNAISLPHVDNAQYNFAQKMGSSAELKALLFDLSNWNTSDVPYFADPSGNDFTIYTRILFASDNTPVWDTNSFNNDVLVIGRDDALGLLQKQSQSKDDSVKIYLGGLAASNSSNTASISNDISFVTIGHNGGRLQGVRNNKPTDVYSRFDRVWKITNVNFIDAYSIKIKWDSVEPFDIIDIRLLVDDDGDFSDATVLGIDDGLSISEGSIVISGINASHLPVNNTRFITLASASSATPLPVELVSFAATRAFDYVSLRWTTATELHNDYFTLEKSDNGLDWNPFAWVDGAGESRITKHYTEHDLQPFSPVTYYRLKQTDFNGDAAYSHIVAVACDETPRYTFEIYPNPNDSNHALIKIDQWKLAKTIEIMDLLGETIYTYSPYDSFITPITFNSTLEAGKYVVKVNFKNGISSLVSFAVVR